MNRLVSTLVLIYVICLVIAIVAVFTIDDAFSRKTPATEDLTIDIKAQPIK